METNSETSPSLNQSLSLTTTSEQLIYPVIHVPSHNRSTARSYRDLVHSLQDEIFSPTMLAIIAEKASIYTESGVAALCRSVDDIKNILIKIRDDEI